MSKQIVKEYINGNERKHLSENCDDYNNKDEWIEYAKTHIYYHLLVVIDGEETAYEEIEKIWKEHQDDEDEDEPETEPETEDEEDNEIQAHCYMCYNMNMNLNITCFVCDKIYCKSHSYCVLGDNDMYYCSKFCFLNC